MEIRPLPPDDAAVRRYVEELWLPYHRELEATVETHDLADDVDLVAEEIPFRQERLEDDDYRLWIAVDEVGPDGTASGDFDLADDGVFAGFVGAGIDEAPSVFERPDRLIVGDIYVREPYRGTGLAHDLIDRVATRARDTGCGELALEVDADNERALAFYEKLGFEPFRHRMRVDPDDL